MFARDGGGGDDDPYNFDIADGFGGKDAKKRSSRKAGGGKLGGLRSQQSRLGKSLLSKTVGSSPSSKSSVNPQVGRGNAKPLGVWWVLAWSNPV